MRIVNLTAVFAIAMLAACGDGPDSTDKHDCSAIGEGSQAWIDWGCESTIEKARVTVNFTYLGAPVECSTFEDGALVANTGETFESEPGTHEYTVGSDDLVSTDGITLHDVGAANPIGCLATADVEDGGDYTVDCVGNQVFSGYYVCESEACLYDSGTPDGKGDVCDPPKSDSRQFIEVVDAMHITTDLASSRLNVGMGNLVVDGDQIAYAGSEAFRVQSSMIKSDKFHFDLVENESDIYSVTCTKQ